MRTQSPKNEIAMSRKNETLKKNSRKKKFKIIIEENLDVESHLCRLCLNSAEKSLYSNNFTFDIMYYIKFVLGIEVAQNDGRPDHICSNCEKIFHDMEELKKTAKATQRVLELEMTSNALSQQKGNGDLQSIEIERNENLNSAPTLLWTCKRCARNFENENDLAVHEKDETCSKDKRYVCEICGVEMKSMARLNRHSDVLQHACASCSYRGRTLYALRTHERTHTRARPHACPRCARTFRSAANLASHRRRHQPPRYHCPTCTKPFRFKEVGPHRQSLQNHLAALHSTAKPHVCNTCGKAFATRKLLCRHERRVHNRPKIRAGKMPTYLKQQQDNVT
ncbi:zinc finger protein 585B isoform X2 [Bombyx mori]|uniref:Uncharacterized protein n=1 Tax=Bombyx mori TaxID=7091 RepID=A0A8R2HR75_BOMMO|nr:zinc finger protein 585B isoform X2 [Bombyx mori]